MASAGARAYNEGLEEPQRGPGRAPGQEVKGRSSPQSPEAGDYFASRHSTVDRPMEHCRAGFQYFTAFIVGLRL